MTVRLDDCERRALKKALKDFKGEVYIFGSRLNPEKKGGDIDILLIPEGKVSPLELSIKVEARFFMECEEDIDVLVYRDTPFFKEILKGAKRIDPEEL